MPDKIAWILAEGDLFRQLAAEDPARAAIPGSEALQLRTDQVSVHALPPLDGCTTAVVAARCRALACDIGRTAFLGKAWGQVARLVEMGLKGIWFNPTQTLVQEPIQDVDLPLLQALGASLDAPPSPSLARCKDWLADWQVPDNVRRHTEKTAWLAYALAVKLREAGVVVDPILTHRGGLLHDLDKICTLTKTGRHGMDGADYVQARGFSRVADIIRNHVMHTILEPTARRWSWESKLVFFCDKLVEGDRLVPFPVRLEALKARYPDYRRVLSRAAPAVFALSDEICSILSMPDHGKLISNLGKLQNI